MNKICLLLNLGGFEHRMQEHLEMAKKYGDQVFSLTGEGLFDVAIQYRVPVNVLSLSKSELQVWSGLINEQLEHYHPNTDHVVILAAGKTYAGIIPVGTNVIEGFRIGVKA
ncbi:hypothetical protein [Paenibacillus polymyxa]|uniref:hypothetical protein n=1 Tax=Paenibacillus polymyxa TaxID=1406 RepID=UPI000589B61B|nr:hypothetical protein [Paenibacillus polymyxa]AJE54245.1 hypothetical protein RE92_24970 [Paenibacillus polymyxa]